MTNPGAKNGHGHADSAFEGNAAAASEYVLSVLKELHNSYSQPIDITALSRDANLRHLGNSILGIFRKQGLISGSEAEAALTQVGHQVISECAQSHSIVAELFSGKTVKEPEQVLLRLLRCGFDAQGGLPARDMAKPADCVPHPLD